MVESGFLRTLGVRIRIVADLNEVALYIEDCRLLLLDIDLSDGQVSDAIDGVLPLGIYNNDSSDLPSTLLLDAGTVIGTSAAVQEATISQALTAGLYWLSCASQGGAPTLRTVGTQSQPPVVANTFTGVTASTGINGYAQNSISGAFANRPAGVPTNFSSSPLIKVRVA